MTTQTTPIGLVETGQTITLPLPVYDELLEHDSEMSLTSPVIPLLKAVKWADERLWCGAVQTKDAAKKESCPMVRRDDQGCYCAANGSKQRTPCAFDEPETAEIWQRTNAYIAWCKEHGIEL